jgi:hypothetical protein
MKTLQELFAFMRKNGFKKACWDNQLKFEPLISSEQMPKLIDELATLDEHMDDQFGDRHDRPLWFYV